MQYKALINAAAAARKRAYAPYSGFKVGAAIATRAGEVFTGCNVENVSFGLTICAERAAVAVAISNGSKDFITIALVTDSSEPAVPCGACRQALSEFNPKLKIIAATVSGLVQEFDLAELFPTPRQGVLEAVRRV
jgi:cytidine deaminase